MRITIEVRDDDELRRIVAALDPDRVEIVVGVDGASVQDTPGIEALLAQTAGLWTAGDGLAYQQAIRGEWPRNDAAS